MIQVITERVEIGVGPYISSIQENLLPHTHGHGESIMPSPASGPCIWIVDDKSVFCIVLNFRKSFYNPDGTKD